MAQNEKTSETVASIAAKILEMENPRLITDEFWKQIQSVAGSALTQVPDKSKLSKIGSQSIMGKSKLLKLQASKYRSIQIKK